MAFDHDVDIGILRQNFRQIAHRAGAVRVDLEAARAEQQLVIHRHVHVSVPDRNGKSLALEAGQCVGHLAADRVDRLLAAAEHAFQLGYAARAIAERHFLVLQLAQHAGRLGRSVVEQLLVASAVVVQLARQTDRVGYQTRLFGGQFLVLSGHVVQPVSGSGELTLEAERLGLHRIELLVRHARRCEQNNQHGNNQLFHIHASF